MILVSGGQASGKRTFARELGYAAEELSADAHATAPVLYDAQELVRADGCDVRELAQRLAAEKQVVLITEVGSGIVPLDQQQRVWRDRAGALSRELAQQASVVVRMVCGIPVVLKGALPVSAEEGKEL